MSQESNGTPPTPEPERRDRAVRRLQNGGGHDSASPKGLSVQPMAPPSDERSSSNALGTNGAPRTPLAEELMTLKVKLPALGASGELDALKTMRVKVPRQEGLDASVVSAAVAQSLQQLNQGTPGPSPRPSDSRPSPAFEPASEPSSRAVPGRSRGDTYGLEDEPADEFVADEAPKIGRELTLRDIFFMVRERWVLGLSVGLLAAGALAYWMMSKPFVYQSVGELLVELNEDKILPMESIEQDGSRANLEQAMEVHAKRLQTSDYRDFVLASLEAKTIETEGQPPKEILELPYKTYESFRQAYAGGLTRMLLRGREKKPNQVIPSAEELIRTDFYGPSLQVTTSKRSPFITLAFRHPDPQVARQVTHAFITCYNSYLSSKEKKLYKDAIVFLRDETGKLEAEIRKQEAALQEFRIANNIVDNIEGDDGPREDDKVQTLDDKVTAAQVALWELELQLKGVETVGESDPLKLSQLPVIAEYGAVSDIKAKLDANREERAQLDVTYLSRHPKILANNAQRESLVAALKSAVSLGVQDLRNRVDQKRDEQTQLQGAVAAAESEVLKSNDPMIEYKVMQSGLDITKSKYKVVLDRLSETQITESLEPTKVDIMTPAFVPDDPVDPDKKKVLALSSLLLLGGLFGIPIGLGFLDTRLKSFSEAEAFLGMECLGCIPERPKLSHMELGQCVLSEQDEQIVEGFRVVYGSVDLHSRTPTPKVIVTTSTGPGEGKSFCTANLAGTFARHGSRVLVIDCDLRKPSQHKLIGSRNDAGILKWFRAGGIPPATAKELVDDADLGLVPLSEEHDIFLLRAGGSTRNPSEIIKSKPFESLLHNLRYWFDVIMIDTPPVGLFPDALFLSHYAEEAIFVCKHNGLNRHKIKFALKKMEGGNAQVLGTIMNQLSASKRHQYGYGYKDYGYGSYSYKEYAKYYQAEEDDEA